MDYLVIQYLLTLVARTWTLPGSQIMAMDEGKTGDRKVGR